MQDENMKDKENQSDSSDGVVEAQPVAQPQGPPPPPNGGFQAWLQVLGAHLLFFNSW
jgi:hypothetical protein